MSLSFLLFVPKLRFAAPVKVFNGLRKGSVEFFQSEKSKNRADSGWVAERAVRFPVLPTSVFF